MKVSRLITPGRGKGLIQGIGYILFINKIVHYLTSLHVAKHEFSASQLTLDALPWGFVGRCKRIWDQILKWITQYGGPYSKKMFFFNDTQSDNLKWTLKFFGPLIMNLSPDFQNSKLLTQYRRARIEKMFQFLYNSVWELKQSYPRVFWDVDNESEIIL